MHYNALCISSHSNEENAFHMFEQYAESMFPVCVINLYMLTNVNATA